MGRKKNETFFWHVCFENQLEQTGEATLENGCKELSIFAVIVFFCIETIDLVWNSEKNCSLFHK